MDHFARFGLPRGFALDEAALERRYLALSREVHPDYHAFAGNVEQQVGLASSAAVNEGYSVLRDPFRRAEYLLQLEGGPSASEVKEMPVSFLEEMLELRMEIEEIKTISDEMARDEMESRLQQRRDILIAEAGNCLTRYANQTANCNPLTECRRLLNATRFVNGLLRDLHSQD